MRQFAAEVSAVSAGARPKTTGSVQQSAVASARRMSTGDSQHRFFSHSAFGSMRNQQPSRLTRNFTLGNLRNSRPAGPHNIDAEPAGLAFFNGTGVTSAASGSGSCIGGGGGGMHYRSQVGMFNQTSSRLPRLESDQQGFPNAKENDNLAGYGLSFGVSALKGLRPYMEDEYKVIPHMEAMESSNSAAEGHEGVSTHFFGVFDGHAGGRCSKALTQILGQTVAREPDFGSELASAVTKGFLKANTEFLRKAERYCANDGSTAITVFVRGQQLVVGNVGDSRAVLCSNRKAVPLSSDHKPNKPEERRRIKALGGRVLYSFGIPRVNGILAVSRAFGDRNMRGSINADPDVKQRHLERGDDFLILATDGLWDVMTSQEACNIVFSCAPEFGPQASSELLTATALRKGSMDNTSAMVVDLRGIWDAPNSALHNESAVKAAAANAHS
ncbi:unnamed protein product, partial [Choristocarpus tenellus]